MSGFGFFFLTIEDADSSLSCKKGQRKQGRRQRGECSVAQAKGVRLTALHLLQESPRPMASPRDAALMSLDPPPHPSGNAQLLRASPGSKGLDVHLYER